MTDHPIYAKINLQETNYKPGKVDYQLLPKDTNPEPLLDIYNKYATYRDFKSAWPI